MCDLSFIPSQFHKNLSCLVMLFLTYIFKFSFSMYISSVQFSHSVMSDSLQPHEPQHARPPCPSPTPRVHQNPCPLSCWCHPTISSSVISSSCLQSFPTSGCFQMIQLFTSGGQSIGVSASTSVLPVNTQDWFPLGWTGWTSLQSLKSLLQHHSSKASILHSIGSCVLNKMWYILAPHSVSYFLAQLWV